MEECLISDEIFVSSPVNADVHLIDGVAADDAVVAPRRLDRNAGQFGRGADQRVERQVDPGCDNAALIGPRIIADVEGRRGPEIDDDQIRSHSKS